ncbi:glycoside hydrolase family 15 protein [Streptomyces rubradiris]|uniref:glycoside hydrolase family 15 protein n=1 Tax=Streptomyces rubradiris TaxID=285531 RepID=UPI0036E4E902
MSHRIEDYASIGNMQTAALVAHDGSVDWLCMPRFDSPAVLAGVLGTEEHGVWRLGPAHPKDTPPPAANRRGYDGTSLILISEWDTEHGAVRVTDFMPPSGGGPQVMRIVEGLRGRVVMRSTLRVRFGYGRFMPRVHQVGDRTQLAFGTDAVWLDTTIPLPSVDDTAEFTVLEGQKIALTLSWQATSLVAAPRPDPYTALKDTAAFWHTWAQQCTYDGPYREAVVRSLTALKALTHAPTGGIVAAPTTSLPEDLGGVRNWDYRYTWLRDAALTISALVAYDYLEEAHTWRTWLVRVIGDDVEDLQIMYGLAGKRDLAEQELWWLPGYEKSSPVRTGNAAAGQLQLDVYGEVLDALHQARRAGLEPDARATRLQLLLVAHLEQLWAKPDEGIWEVRGPRRHFVHSKVMAWVAFDRAIQLIESGEADGPLEHWRELRDTIHREVCEKGYDPVRNTFTQSYGSKELDASLLLIPQVGFLAADDERVVGTIEAIQRELSTPDGFILRYPTDGEDEGVDGLPDDEGAFLLCAFWMVEDLAMIGRTDEAHALFDKLLALRSPLGLLAEEWDPRSKRQVGNFPQAFSHAGLALAARRLMPQVTLSLPGQRSTEPSLTAVPAIP